MLYHRSKCYIRYSPISGTQLPILFWQMHSCSPTVEDALLTTGRLTPKHPLITAHNEHHRLNLTAGMLV